MRDPVIGMSDDCRLYVLARGFMVDHPRLPGGRMWLEPGFEFDGGTIPQIFHDIVHPGEPWGLRAWIVHDKLCHEQLGTAHDAAIVMRDLLAGDAKLAGVPQWKVDAVFRAVDLAGPQFGNSRPQRLNRRPFEAR